MVKNEKDLAKAIMRGDLHIELHSSLVNGVRKIKDPSEVVWKSVAAVLITSAFFWGSGAGGVTIGFMLGLPAVLAVCGGVGGIVFVTLGASGTMCAFRLLMATKTMDVLTGLRNKYDLKDTTLIRK